MKVSIKLIATYRKLLPEDARGNTVQLDVPPGARVEDVLIKFNVPSDRASVILVNGHVPVTDQQLDEGDVITAFPAMAGG